MSKNEIIPQTIINTIKKQFLNTDDYKYGSLPASSKLSDKVVLYNNGNQWNVIPFDVILSYPIIYDKYSIDDEEYDITVALCPITLRCVIFKGLFEFETYEGYRMVLREITQKEGDVFIPIDLGIKIDNKYLIRSNRRLEAMIMTLRNALTMAPDVAYMNCNKKINYVIGKEYYSNELDVQGNILDGLIHPKTLIYVIQYKTYNSGEEKTSLILGKNAVKGESSGYDIKKSGLDKYLATHKQKIINREGYIMPMLWYMAKDIYKTSRLVYIY